jgi:uncharacterized protein (TIGR02466 family)
MLYTKTPFAVPVFICDASWEEKSILQDKISHDPTKVFDQTYHVEGDKDFNGLIKIINDTLPDIIEKMGYKQTPCDITSMWVNNYKENEFVHPHYHSNSWLSGVYYPYGNESSPIVFQNPFNTSMIVPDIAFDTEYNVGNIDYKIKRESIMFFPSWLRHFTMPNGIDNNKVSVAFNIMPTGDVNTGNINKLKI